MNTAEALHTQITNRQKTALFAGIGGGVVAVIGFLLNREQFFHAYLYGYMFWMGMSLGCLGLLILHNLSGGDWGHAIRRAIEAGTRTFPLMALLFLPVLLTVWMGTGLVYEWADPEHVAKDAILQQKSHYLNSAFFTARYVLYFLIWGIMAQRLYKWSSELDRTPDDLSIVRRMENISGPGAVIMFLTITFSAFDWVMSPEPHWYSTIYGLLFIVNDGLATFALMIILLYRLSEYEPFSYVTEKHFHDLGKLTHAFVVLWAYGSFSQFLIIWSGNLPEEIPWYLKRLNHGWEWVGISLMFGQFLIPFLILLGRRTKRRKQTLWKIAAFILFMQMVNLLWFVVPVYHDSEHLSSLLPYSWIYIAILVGIGGAWFANVFWSMQARPLTPLPDPYSQAEHAADQYQHA